uniref:Protein VAC14 homolog n=1 Tax=Caenorhabditis japonica TaxID=281687 RepID=A0A8R1DTG3_CAEJA
MSDGQYGPISAGIIRSITDKSYERRKAAALDVEKLVRDLFNNNQLSQLDRCLTVLAELINSGNSNQRKGGLIGMAAAAIALGNKNAPPYTSKLVEPIIPCFLDSDLQIRYYACESLYNIAKICKSAVLEHFEDIFDVLWRVTADSDQNVRGGAELLNRLVTEIVLSKEDFDVAILMSLIRDRIYTQTTSNRRFILEWLNTIYSAPFFSICNYISEISDGLFKMLGEQAPAVRDQCETVLGSFLTAIKHKPETLAYEDRIQMVNVLVVHAHENEPFLSRKLSLIWLEEFVKLYKEELLVMLSTFLVAILPSIVEHDLRADAVNRLLMALVGENKLEQDILDKTVEVLLKFIKHDIVETRVTVLNWIRHLHHSMPGQIFAHIHNIFPVLLNTLSDTSDEVLLLDLFLISNICQSEFAPDQVDVSTLGLDAEALKQVSHISPFLIKFALSLLEMFRTEPSLLRERGVLIIRQLCLLLEPAHIYRVICVLLEKESKHNFAQEMVSTLHGVLLTATELFILRDELRALSTESARSLFECLFRVWSNRPIALLGLCLLSQHYQQAADVALLLSQVDITVDVLLEIDKLVNLVESPVLACEFFLI